MFNHIKEDNEIPDQWTQVQISTMYKNKGKRKRLLNQRGIFLKQVLSKMYGKLNMNRAGKAMESMDKCQAGGRTNRSIADHTYLLRAAIDHCKYLDRPLYVTFYDYSQCFDSLWLSDCLLSLLKLGVEKEVVSILRKLNEKCNIVIKTPLGMTDEFEMESIVQQGSVSGSALCVASTSEIAKEDLGVGCQIGAAILKALAYIDDIATLSRDHLNAYVAHKSVEWFSAKKRLLLNALKCVLLCIDTKPGDIIPRLKLGDTVLREVDSAPYLGDQYNKAGNNKDLISERVKKGKACIVNAMSVCAEITMGTYTIHTLILLYRSLFLQVVLSNAQAWSNLTETNIKDLQVVQLRYLKRMLHAPTSTSNPLTFLETGTIPIENEIHIKQFNYLHHILTLENDDIVKVTYTEQIKNPFEPNLGNTLGKLRVKYGIEEKDEEVEQMSKESWKNKVKDKINSYVIAELKHKAESQKCGRNFTFPTELQQQEYLTSLPSANARKVFHVRTGTVDLKSVRKYRYGDDTNCRLCGGDDENVNHVVNECPAIHRGDKVINVHSTDCEELLELSNRCINFDTQVEEAGKMEGMVE